MSKDMLGPLTRALVGVPARTLGLLLDIANRLSSVYGENFFADLAKFVREWKYTVVEETKVYLRRLFTATIGATDGTDTYETATKVFDGWLDSDFKNWGIIFSGVASEIDIDVNELIEDGKFPDFFGNSVSHLKKRHLLGSQFLKFCREHPDKLRKDGYGTFFLLTRGDEPINDDFSNVFVASAGFGGIGRLEAYVFEFSRDRVWNAGLGRHLVAPQQ
ncbi:MAG: hypothetical protein WC793_03035 [Candidatus Paceibacterota bacterium]|jgi:hypothetical protein